MNHLAHLYLSGKDTNLLIGNFITDFLRGKELKMFKEKYSDGIALHRYIDI